MNEHKSKVLDLACPFLLGQNLQTLLFSIDKAKFDARGENGLIKRLEVIRDGLKYININPSTQLEIGEKISYLNVKYVEPLILYAEPLETFQHIDLNDAMECKKDIENWINVISEELKNGQIELPIIFIGHGHNNVWKDLRDHLQGAQGFKIESYESDIRAGFMIPKEIDKMIRKSSMSIIILTGEIEDIEGRFHARDNVIHELGYSAGVLGNERTIIILEKKNNFSEPSNIQGIQQIQFHNMISETFGDVVASIRREFPCLHFTHTSKLSNLQQTLSKLVAEL